MDKTLIQLLQELTFRHLLWGMGALFVFNVLLASVWAIVLRLLRR